MSTIPYKTTMAGALLLAGTVYVFAAQLAPGSGPGNGPMGSPGLMHEQMHGQMTPGGPGGFGPHGVMHGQQFGQQLGGTSLPASPGQDAFGAIQEIVQILEADPSTDWTKVNIEALREHLVDMNEVTLNAVAEPKMTENGIEIVVTGDGRTRAAIKRMVPAHVHELVRLGWNANTSELPDGVKLIVTANNAAPLAKLKALGFIGIMVQGGHHQPHHLMMAKGSFVH